MNKEPYKKFRANRTICLNDEMDDFIKHLGLSEKLQEIKILTIWEGCVGSVIAQNSRPVGLKKNKLYISVESAVWRQELFIKKRNIIDKFNLEIKDIFPGKYIKEIIFV